VSPEEEGELKAIERAIKKTLPRVPVPDFDYSAKPQAKLEVPIAERIAEIRKKKAEDRARAAEKASRRVAAQEAEAARRAAKAAKPERGPRGPQGGSRPTAQAGDAVQSGGARRRRGGSRRPGGRGGAGANGAGAHGAGGNGPRANGPGRAGGSDASRDRRNDSPYK